MRIRDFFVAAAMGLVLLPGAALCATQNSKPSGKTATYRWVDKNNIVHYGDTVPPEYSTQAREELNRQGVPVREFPRQLSPAEAVDAQKVAANEAKRRQHDSFLLTTYTQVSDIEQLRDERMALIDSQMEIARGSMTSTTQRVDTLRTRMESFQPYAKSATARRMPDQLAEEVVRAMKDQNSLQSTLDAREKEKGEMRAGFDADIARFRELTERPDSR